jgi:hypothetical protein
MPHLPTVTEIRANNITTCLKLATTLFNELHDALGTSSLQAISQVARLLITALQVRYSILGFFVLHRSILECEEKSSRMYPALRGHPHSALCCYQSPSRVQYSRRPSTDDVRRHGKFHSVCFEHFDLYTMLTMEGRTAHKIHTYLEAQQEGTRIRNFFRQRTRRYPSQEAYVAADVSHVTK